MTFTETPSGGIEATPASTSTLFLHFNPDGISIIIDGGIPKPRILVRRSRKLVPHVIEFYDVEDSDITGHWENAWQDKWQGPADAAFAKLNEDLYGAITGKWETSWQDKWLPEYMKWLTPHPVPITHSVAQANELVGGHGPERVLSHLPDAIIYEDLSNPPALIKRNTR